jgi:hypothetical protein
LQWANDDFLMSSQETRRGFMSKKQKQTISHQNGRKKPWYVCLKVRGSSQSPPYCSTDYLKFIPAS